MKEAKLHESLKSQNIKWNQLFEKQLKHEAFYFGIYETIYKKGFYTAEQNLKKRLDKFIHFLNSTKYAGPIGYHYLKKFQESYSDFDYPIDFKSYVFKTKCIELLKPIHRLSKTKVFVLNRKKILGSLISIEDKKVIDLYLYQLNPYNYSYPELKSLYYVNEFDTLKLLQNDEKNRILRRLDNLRLLNRFIQNHIKNQDAQVDEWQYRYALCESNPFFEHNESVIFKGVGLNQFSVSGFRQVWTRDTFGNLALKDTIYDWRR